MTLKYALMAHATKAPMRKNPTDAGVDVYSAYHYDIAPGDFAIVRTGIAFSIPENVMLLAKPKSGARFLVGAGVIDPGYQGEIMVKVFNVLPEMLYIKSGDAVAQLVEVPILTDALEEVSLEEVQAVRTARGTDGGIVRETASYTVSE